MKILNIGGTGVLSTDIVKECVSLGCETYILNRGLHLESMPVEAMLLKANVRDLEEVDRALGDRHFDVVVDYLSYNAKQLKASFEYFQDRCEQYIYISSACAFRRFPEDGIINENSLKPNPNLPYSINKYEGEKYIFEAGKRSKCKFTVVRPYITYGDTRIPFGIAPLARYHWTIVSRILNDKPMFVWDDGRAKCTLTHTTDFANMFVQLFLNEKAYNEDFNLVGDECLTWRELLEILYKIVGKTYNVVSIPSEKIAKLEPSFKDFILGDRSLNAEFDNRKLKNVIHFEQKIKLEDGLKHTIQFYKERGYLSGIDYAYDAQIDRLIYKYAGKNFGFVDYLGNATFKQKYTYVKYKYGGPLLCKLLNKFEKFVSNVKKALYKK